MGDTLGFSGARAKLRDVREQASGLACKTLVHGRLQESLLKGTDLTGTCERGRRAVQCHAVLENQLWDSRPGACGGEHPLARADSFTQAVCLISRELGEEQLSMRRSPSSPASRMRGASSRPHRPSVMRVAFVRH